MAGGEEGPAVGGAFGYPEGLGLAEAAEDGEVVDGAAGALGEAETKPHPRPLSARRGGNWVGLVVEVTVLDADEVVVLVEVGDLEPVGALAVLPGGEAAPADDAGVEAADFEEEVTGFGGETGVLEEGGVAGGVEGSLTPGPSPWGEGCGMLGVASAVGEVEAGFAEVFVEEVADEVDGVAVGAAGEAAVGVFTEVEGEGGVVVVVEGAEGLVAVDLDAEAGGDFFDGEGS